MKDIRAIHNQRGMTLLEMLVSMAIVTLMLGAVSSAVVIAARAAERQSPASFDDTSPSTVLDRLLREASLAVAVTEYTSTAITFVLPDQTGDLIDESVRYSWSGTVGDPMIRRFNKDAPVPASGGVRSLSFKFDTTIASEPLTPVRSINTQVEIASFISPILGSQSIDPNRSLSQYVRPAFPDGTISWTVTSIDLYAKKGGEGKAAGSIQLELRTPTDIGMPGIETHSTVSVTKKKLPIAYAWTTHTFVNAPRLAPGDAITFVASDTANTISAIFPLASQNSSRSFAAQGNVAAATWKKIPKMSTLYRIQGTIVTQPPDTTINHTILMRISAELESINDEIARGATSVFNHPELL